MGRSGRQAVRIWALHTNKPSGSWSSGYRARSPAFSSGPGGRPPLPYVDRGADGEAYDVLNVVESVPGSVTSSIRACSPVSSASSRTTVCSRHSPGSTVPPGSSRVPRRCRPSSPPCSLRMMAPTPMTACGAGGRVVRGRLERGAGRLGRRRARISRCTTGALSSGWCSTTAVRAARSPCQWPPVPWLGRRNRPMPQTLRGPRGIPPGQGHTVVTQSYRGCRDR